MESIWYRAWGVFSGLFIRRIATRRALFFFEKMRPFLVEENSLLDLGAGTGYIAALLTTLASQCVEMIDVIPRWGQVGQWMFAIPWARTFARRFRIPHRLYDGRILPYDDGRFDTVLLAFVLHHAHDSDRLFEEAVRVAGARLLVFEDVFETEEERSDNRVADAIVNVEVGRHPHANRSREAWHALFAKHGLHLVHEESFTSTLVGFSFPNTFFVLEKEKTMS